MGDLISLRGRQLYGRGECEWVDDVVNASLAWVNGSNASACAGGFRVGHCRSEKLGEVELHHASIHALEHAVPEYVAGILAFTFTNMIWSQHHNLFMQLSQKVSQFSIWTNTQLVMCTSLIPFFSMTMCINPAFFSVTW